MHEILFTNEQLQMWQQCRTFRLCLTEYVLMGKFFPGKVYAIKRILTEIRCDPVTVLFFMRILSLNVKAS